MTETKRIVCLASSRKSLGRCIAGREWSDEQGVGSWIRPVSARPGEEVAYREREYEGGGEPQLLDIVDIPVVEARPHHHQTENWLLDSTFRWRNAGRFAGAVSLLEDSVLPLWENGYSSSVGLNDRIPKALAWSLSDSLRLIKVDALQLSVCAPGEPFGDPRKRVQGRFSWAGNQYAMWMTDGHFEPIFKERPFGMYKMDECYLTISLGEPYSDDFCYKFIAAMIPASQLP